MTAKILAFAFDNDDFLTRSTAGSVIYQQAAHQAFYDVHGQHVMDFPAWEAWQVRLHELGECIFTAAAEKFGVCRLQLFRRFHECVDTSHITHDTESAPALMALKERAVIFTDASLGWTRAHADRIGHDLPILSRDADHTGFKRKAQSPERFEHMRATLSEMTGQELKPENILFGDDSASALRTAKGLGFRTLHGHWGYPGRAHTDEFDFSTDHVGTWLLQKGYVAA